jgi:hypothetical protein
LELQLHLSSKGQTRLERLQFNRPEKEGKIDIKATFDLKYLSVYPLLDNREIVEEDMKELKRRLMLLPVVSAR